MSDEKKDGEKKICGKCEKEITGEYITAMDKVWCDGHFSCAGEKCDANLKGTPYYEREGKPFCKDCFGKTHANVCHACNEPILSKTVTAMDAKWHEDCFVCCECKEPLIGKSYYKLDGKPMCQADYTKASGNYCKGCGESITGTVLTALGSKWHKDCFVCGGCKKPLGGQPFYLKDDKPMCDDCK